MTWTQFLAKLAAAVNAAFPVGTLALLDPYYGIDLVSVQKAFNAAVSKGTDPQQVISAVLGLFGLWGGGPTPGPTARIGPNAELTSWTWTALVNHFLYGSPLPAVADVTPTPAPGGPCTLSNALIISRAANAEPYRCDGTPAFGDMMIVDVTDATGKIFHRRADGKPTFPEKTVSAPYLSPAFVAVMGTRSAQFGAARKQYAAKNPDGSFTLSDNTLAVAVYIHGVLDGYPGKCVDAAGTLTPLVGLDRPTPASSGR